MPDELENRIAHSVNTKNTKLFSGFLTFTLTFTLMQTGLLTFTLTLT
jgi:hypothetical protein